MIPALCLLYGNDRGAAAVILYTALMSNNSRVGYARVDKDVGLRRLEAIQIVCHEDVASRVAPVLAYTASAALARPRILLFKTELP